MAYEDLVSQGWIRTPDGGVVPPGHPLAAQYDQAGLGQTQQQPQQAQGPAATNINQQAQNASTYSPTPGAAPMANTTNQGTQDVVRNSWLAKATQGTQVDTQDPNFRQQADTYGAAIERARRNYVADQAERLGPYQSGALQGEARMASERAGQATGQFEAELVGRELQNRRNEIVTALSTLGGMISDDQRMALQKQLAELDATLRREGLAQTGALGGRELDIRDRLGTGALNLDMIRTLLQNQQFGQDLGYRIGSTEAQLNADALRYALGL